MKTKQDFINPLPSDLWLEIINHLEYEDISSFTSTCTFFSPERKENELDKKQLLNIKQNKLLLYAPGFGHKVLYVNRKLFVSGSNGCGQLGLGHKEKQLAFVECKLELKEGECIVQIVLGRYNTFLRTNRHRILVCGANTHGELGLDYVDCKSSAVFVEYKLDLLPNEMITAMAAGDGYFFISTNQNSLSVVGDNFFGQLGFGKYSPPKKTMVTYKIDLLLNEYITDIAAGAAHTIFRTNKNRLFVCGNNSSGQLGLGHNKHCFIISECKLDGLLLADEYVQEIAAGREHTLLKTSQNRLLVCGENDSGQLGLGNRARQNSFVHCELQLGDIVSIGAHFFLGTSYLITNQNKLFVCGYNEDDSAMGLKMENQSIFSEVCFFLQPNEQMKGTVFGDRCTFILTNQNTWYVCGDNRFGLLGLGEYRNYEGFTGLFFNAKEDKFIQQEALEQEVSTIKL